jgi:hypothetical protein
MRWLETRRNAVATFLHSAVQFVTGSDRMCQTYVSLRGPLQTLSGRPKLNYELDVSDSRRQSEEELLQLRVKNIGRSLSIRARAD